MSILFPFYKAERHTFLRQKWWFRMLIAFYIVAFLVLVPKSWYESMFSMYENCVRGVEIYYGGRPHPANEPEAFEEYYDSLEACNEAAMISNKSWEARTVYVLVIALIIHYLLQLIFFKVIIDFIAVGGKKKEVEPI